MFLPPDVQALQVLTKDAFAALGSSLDGPAQLLEYKTLCKANKSKLKESLRVSEIELSDAEQYVQEIELTKDTVDHLATKVDKAEKALSIYQEPVQYLEDRVGEKSNKMLAKDGEVMIERERLANLESRVRSLWAVPQQSRETNMTDKNVLKGSKLFWLCNRHVPTTYFEIC